LNGRGHALAIARIVVAHVEEEASRGPRRLVRSQLRWTAEQPDDHLASELGVLRRVEQARDEHLAGLDADEGLAALSVPWENVVAEAVDMLERPPPTTCERCGARLPRRRPVCSRCRLPVPR
jgi:hypothetical protein